MLRSFVLSEEQTIDTVGQSSCNLLNRIFAFPLGDWLTTSIWTDVFSQSKFLYCSFQQQTFILLKRTGPFKTFLTTFMRVHLKLDVVKCLTTKTFVLSLHSYLAHSIETAFLKTNLRCKEPKAAVFTRGNYQKNKLFLSLLKRGRGFHVSSHQDCSITLYFYISLMVLSASSWNKIGSKRIHMTSVFTLAHWVSVTFTTDFERFLNTLNLPCCYLSDAFTSKKLGFLWHWLILAASQCRLKLWLVTAWGNWAINVTFYFKITSHNRLLTFFKPLFNHALPAALQWLLSRFEWIFIPVYIPTIHMM